MAPRRSCLDGQVAYQQYILGCKRRSGQEVQRWKIIEPWRVTADGEFDIPIGEVFCRAAEGHGRLCNDTRKFSPAALRAHVESKHSDVARVSQPGRGRPKKDDVDKAARIYREILKPVIDEVSESSCSDEDETEHEIVALDTSSSNGGSEDDQTTQNEIEDEEIPAEDVQIVQPEEEANTTVDSLNNDQYMEQTENYQVVLSEDEPDTPEDWHSIISSDEDEVMADEADVDEAAAEQSESEEMVGEIPDSLDNDVFMEDKAEQETEREETQANSNSEGDADEPLENSSENEEAQESSDYHSDAEEGFENSSEGEEAQETSDGQSDAEEMSEKKNADDFDPPFEPRPPCNPGPKKELHEINISSKTKQILWGYKVNFVHIRENGMAGYRPFPGIRMPEGYEDSEPEEPPREISRRSRLSQTVDADDDHESEPEERPRKRARQSRHSQVGGSDDDESQPPKRARRSRYRQVVDSDDELAMNEQTSQSIEEPERHEQTPQSIEEPETPRLNSRRSELIRNTAEAHQEPEEPTFSTPLRNTVEFDNNVELDDEESLTERTRSRPRRSIRHVDEPDFEPEELDRTERSSFLEVRTAKPVAQGLGIAEMTPSFADDEPRNEIHAAGDI